MERTITRKRASVRSQALLKKQAANRKQPDIEKEDDSKEQVITRRTFIKEFLIFATLGYAVIAKEIRSLANKEDIPKAITRPIETKLKTGEHENPDIGKSVLQKRIEQYISKMRESGKIASDETAAWLVYDLVNKKELVLLNENIPLQSASMVKPLIALAFFHKVKNGEIGYTDKHKRYLTSMLQRSRNYATNWIMQEVGGPEEVNSILKDNYGDIFRQTEIVEYIPPGGTTYKNKASASDYNRFLYALWNNVLPYSDEIKRFMSLPKGYTALGNVPPGATIYHKTGNTAQLCGDIAILEAEGRKGTLAYTVISIIEKEQSASYYAGWKRVKRSVLRDGSNIIHDFMKETNGLG